MLGWANSQSWISHQLSYTHSTKGSSPAVPWLAHSVLQLPRSRASSPALMPLEPAHPHPLHQDQLYSATQARCRASSPSAAAGEGAGPSPAGLRLVGGGGRAWYLLPLAGQTILLHSGVSSSSSLGSTQLFHFSFSSTYLHIVVDAPLGVFCLPAPRVIYFLKPLFLFSQGFRWLLSRNCFMFWCRPVVLNLPKVLALSWCSSVVVFVRLCTFCHLLLIFSLIYL